MFFIRLAVSLVIGLSFILSLSPPILADVYRYRDKNGVWHFTNIKTDRRYKLYIRSSKKKPSEYIREYENIIKQASRVFKVEPFLIKAVIKAESDFDNRAVSRKGAQGLMQLMPDTANDMEVEDPFSPEENIFGGTRYLSILLERFKNNKRLALAAYNAGPEAVEEYGEIPPFPETRSFVKRVMRYYKKYRPGPQ